MQEYRVRLDAFDGPLDLLLFLIRRAEVEITDIPIAQITRQYLEFLEQADRIDIDTAGEFLVMAATLMEIKSRTLQPAAVADEKTGERPVREEADPRAELVRQLLEYKKFRDAASALDARLSQWERRYPAGRAGASAQALREALSADDPDLDDLVLMDLVEAYRRISATVNFDRLGEHEIAFDDTPIELHAEDLLDHLRTRADGGEVDVPFASILAGRPRVEMIGLFLAVLELVRQRRIFVRQEAGRIVVGLRADDPQAPPPA